ncbi:hypothetical protein QEN19_000301 [Hanseniaspora menglaensis]
MEQNSDENPWDIHVTNSSVIPNNQTLYEAGSRDHDTSTNWVRNKQSDNTPSSLNIFEDQKLTKNFAGFESKTKTTIENTPGVKRTKTDLSEWFNELRREYANYIEFPSKIALKQLEPKGLAFFKHIEYELNVLNGSGNMYTTTRRYSDFSWLLEYLLQKYPFRLLPELPPKIIPKNDPKVLKKRLDGLSYFSELLLNHPIISNNDVIKVFFEVDCEFASWRKSNNSKIDFTEEFLNLKIEQFFLNGWDKKYMGFFVSSLGKLDTQVFIWEKLIQHVDRHYSKQRSLFNEEFNMIQQLNELTSKECLNETFPLIDDLNYLEIHETKIFLQDAKKCYTELVELPKNENYFTANFDRVMASFHIVLMTFQAMKALKERFDCLSGNNILVLNDKIESNIQYLNNLIKNSPDSKSQEYDSIQKNIIRDKLELREQLNRQWLIKKCLMEEFLWFNEFNIYIRHHTLSEYIKKNSQFMDICASKWNAMFEL